MLPIRLKLKNFLPYRSPDALAFDGIHLACLTGPNGAGKSSILDAITWALWGKARVQRDDELVHSGQSEMFVEFDFEQEGLLYRVVRQRTKGKRGVGALSFYLVQDDGELTNLTEPSMRATQHRINELLRLDYDVFVHSAFLQQGKADAFTTKAPAERKKILSDILGLAIWSRYEDQVKEQLKTISTTLTVFDTRIADIDTELAKEPQYQADEAAASEAYAVADVALQDAEARLSEVSHAADDLRRAQENAAASQRRLNEYGRDQQSAQAEIERHQQTLSDYEQTLQQRETIETGYEALQQAREVDSALGEKLQTINDLDRRQHDLERQLEQARQELLSERREHETRLSELQRALQAVDDDGRQLVQREIADLEAFESERDEMQAKISELSSEQAGLDATLKTLEAEGGALNERMERLQQTDGATCPLCGQELTDTHREGLLAEITQERDDKREQYKQHLDRVKVIQDELRQARVRINELGLELKRLPALRERAGALQKQVSDAQDARDRAAETQIMLDNVLKTLQAEDFALELRRQLADLTEERQQVGYDRQSHDSARETLSSYRQYETQHTQLQIAAEALPGVESALDNAQKRLDRLNEVVAEETAALSDLNAEIDRLRLLVEEQRRREDEVRQQRTAANSAHERLAIARQQLQSLETQRQRHADLSAQRAQTVEQESVYKELRLAFGRNGVPAMIIETAIPELEAEANELLARMTDGRMHLRLTTQREKVTGGTSETLDIEIADQLGTRSYELYSGGEAFRINFALRVALSRMLARRAGAHLRTLFIDEGFGTQDDDGRSKLVDAITTIQDYFDRVLVITHIDELRDHFPVHIVVSKTASGSAVSVQ